MTKITPAQMRKIYALARERGMDDELLHIHVSTLSGKEHLKELTLPEAIVIIDSLAGKQIAGLNPKVNPATMKQCSYLEGLASELGWTDEDGKVDMLRLNGFAKSQYGVDRYQWLTKSQASNVIEALKGMLERQQNAC